MSLKEFGYREQKHPLQELSDLSEQAKDTTESIREGFVFAVPQEIRDLPIHEAVTTDVEGKKSINKSELLKASMAAAKNAWEKAIQPRIKKIREGAIDPSAMKGGGVDFFTEADMQGEEIIKQELIARFGNDAFRIFGEEKNDYVGNLESKITVRIDPIDGTQNFKFGRKNWGIMIGIYAGDPGNEQEIISLVYSPERSEIMYSVDTVGAFVSDVDTGETVKIDHLDEQNDINNMIIGTWRHSNLDKRGPIDAITLGLEKAGARILTSEAPNADVRTALMTKGKVAMVLDGDHNQVDYIPYPPIIRLGYRIFDWDGTEYNVDDPALTEKKVVIIPPGKAGEQILDIVKSNNKK